MATVSASLTKFGKGNIIDPVAAKRGIKSALDRVEKQIKADYKETVKAWKRKPDPTAENESEASRVVGMDDSEKVYGYVDRGTRPHIIRPRRASYLAFQSGYRAKTSPGVIGSRQGGAFGGRRFAKVVNHPGNKARRFTEAIARKREGDLQREVDKELSII